MFRRIAQVLTSKCEYVISLVNHAMGQYKRYRKAADKAAAAAREYLAVPSGKNVFEPLTPVLLEVDRSQRYESELLSALSNDQIRNIAITGEYGAGKSSVIRTFADRHPELTYAFVSLAAFGKDLNKGGAGKVTSSDAPVALACANSVAWVRNPARVTTVTLRVVVGPSMIRRSTGWCSNYLKAWVIAAARSTRRKSSTAACWRWSMKAQKSSKKASLTAARTSIRSGSTAMVFRQKPAGPCIGRMSRA